MSEDLFTFTYVLLNEYVMRIYRIALSVTIKIYVKHRKRS